MISASQICCIKNGREILKNVSFTANTGEILGIIGPNGAGKTTLLGAISGSDKEFTGTVEYNSKNINDFSHKELAKVRSVVSQKVTFNLPMKPIEIALMGRHPYGGENNLQDYEIAQKAIELAECGDFAERNYLTLSGGEQQRVQIARSLAQVAFESNGKRYLLLDEPTSSLDIGKAFRLMTILKSVLNENLGIIWIVHDINLAIKFTDKLLLLNRGEVFGFGKTQEIATEEAISKLYQLPLKLHKDQETNSFHFVPRG